MPTHHHVTTTSTHEHPNNNYAYINLTITHTQIYVLRDMLKALFLINIITTLPIAIVLGWTPRDTRICVTFLSLYAILAC